MTHCGFSLRDLGGAGGEQCLLWKVTRFGGPGKVHSSVLWNVGGCPEGAGGKEAMVRKEVGEAPGQASSQGLGETRAGRAISRLEDSEL